MSFASSTFVESSTSAQAPSTTTTAKSPSSPAFHTVSFRDATCARHFLARAHRSRCGSASSGLGASRIQAYVARSASRARRDASATVSRNASLRAKPSTASTARACEEASRFNTEKMARRHDRRARRETARARAATAEARAFSRLASLSANRGSNATRRAKTASRDSPHQESRRGFVFVFCFSRDPTADRRRVSRPGASRDTKNARVFLRLDVSAEIAPETSPESYASRRSARIVSAAAAASSKTRRFAKSDKRVASKCVEASLSTYVSTPLRSASIRSTGGSSGFPRRSTTRPPAPPTVRVAPRHGGRRVSRLFAARRRRKPTTRLAFASAAAAAARSASSNLRRAFSFSRALRARRRLRLASPEASVSPASAGDVSAGAAPEGGVPSRVPPPPASCALSAAAREKRVITCLARSSPSRFASCAARARAGPPPSVRGLAAVAF